MAWTDGAGGRDGPAGAAGRFHEPPRANPQNRNVPKAESECLSDTYIFMSSDHDENNTSLEEERRYYRQEELEELYRPPAFVTLVFVLTMLAIYFAGRSIEAAYPGLG